MDRKGIIVRMSSCWHRMLSMSSIVVLLSVGSLYAPDIYAQSTTGLSHVVLDAGHGGKDPGAMGKKAKEKDIVLDVALKLGKMINDSLPTVKTTYTRSDDTFVALNERANIANKAKADLFISIHANSSKSKDVTGAETFVLGLHRSKENLELAQKENAVIVMEDDYTETYEGFDPNQAESYIAFGLMASAYLENSILMASQVQESFVRLQRGDRGVKQAGFLVLRQTAMPSILIELGFISNDKEEEYLMSDAGKNELVVSIYNAFKQYKATYDAMNIVSRTQKKEETIEKGVVYRLQIATTSKPLESLDEQYGEVKLVTEEKDGKQIYKYFIGCERKYSEIQKLQKKARKDYKDCFVVAFEDGKKVELKYARKKE